MPASLSSGNVSLSALVGNTVFEPVDPSSFDLLETTTLTSDTASVTFSSLNSTYGSDYKHLQIRYLARGNRASSTFDSILVTVNNDSGSNYYHHNLRGNGSNVASGGLAFNAMIFGQAESASSPSNTFTAGVVDLLDAFNTSKNTTSRELTGSTGNNLIRLQSNLWNNTNAVNELKFEVNVGSDFVTGSRFSLYGIKAGA